MGARCERLADMKRVVDQPIRDEACDFGNFTKNTALVTFG